VPSTFGFLFLSDQIIGGVFQTGKFDAAATQIVAATLSGAGAGLLANASVRVLNNVFYAKHDTRTPMFFSIARVLLSFGLSYGLSRRYGVVGLTVGSSIGGWIEAVLMASTARRLVGGLGLPGARWVKIFLASAVAAVAGYGAKQLAIPWVLVRAGVSIGAFGVVYLAAAWALKLPELDVVKRRLVRR
jgi:putative peptidoglycan lipid II flippase